VRAPLDRTLAAGEVFLVHLAYAGPDGYWAERSAVFAFGPPAPDEARLIDAASCALDRAARAAAVGTRAAAVHAAVVAAYGECGFNDAESYDLHVHPIGTDEDEHAAGSAGDWELEHGCVVALHPAVRLRGGRGYYLARTYAVEAAGAVPLTPAGRAIREVTPAAPEVRPSN
jgi:Xaa-Pro aminopeptidase